MTTMMMKGLFIETIMSIEYKTILKYIHTHTPTCNYVCISKYCLLNLRKGVRYFMHSSAWPYSSVQKLVNKNRWPNKDRRFFLNIYTFQIYCHIILKHYICTKMDTKTLWPANHTLPPLALCTLLHQRHFYRSLTRLFPWTSWSDLKVWTFLLFGFSPRLVF